MDINNLFNFKETVLNQNEKDIMIHENSYFRKVKDLYNCSTSSHKNVGLYCKINSKKLLIVVGESWTYGDSLHPYVKAIDGVDNLPYRISTIFSGKVANWLSSDLLLYSQPGDSNINYWKKLEDILEFVFIDKYYDDVYLIVQMTSPGRDYSPYMVRENLSHLFSTSKNNFPILNWDEWHYEYDKTYFNWLQKIVTKYPIKSTVLWKNFNEFHFKERESYNFNVIETPFHRYAVEMSGETFVPSKNLEMTFYENVSKLYNLNTNMEIMNDEMDKIKIGFDKLSHSMLNSWHPNENGHWVISTLIREKFEYGK